MIGDVEKAILEEYRSRQRARLVDRARQDETAGFSLVVGELTEVDGIPQAIDEVEIGAAWVDDDPQDRAAAN